jgi:hypothetical protein
VAWLIPMNHSRSAAGVWKRDEPHGRLRDATSPQGDARSKPSKSGGTTRTEGAGGLADPCPEARGAARQSTDWLERPERAGRMSVLWRKPGMKSERTRIADVDGGDSPAQGRCARPRAVLWQPQERKSAADPAGIGGSQPHCCPRPASRPYTNVREGRPPVRCPRRRSEGQEGWFQGRPDDPGGEEREAPCRPAPPFGRTRSRRLSGEGPRSTPQSSAKALIHPDRDATTLKASPTPWRVDPMAV